MRSRAAGFTLTELIIGMGLFAFMLAGMASVYALAFRGRGDHIRQTAVDNNGTLFRQILGKAFAQATMIASPDVGAQATHVTLLQNVDPSDGSSAIVPDLPRRYWHFCLNASGSTLFLHRGDLPMPAIVCGQGAGEPITFGQNMRLTARFMRFQIPPGGTVALPTTNTVVLDYSVRYTGFSVKALKPARGVTEYTIRHAL